MDMVQLHAALIALAVSYYRTTKFEELVTEGSRLLVQFQQGLEFIRRPSIEKTSKLVEDIIKANESRRLLSYVEGGCINALDSVENLNKSKSVVVQLESLAEDAKGVMQSESLPPLLLKDNEWPSEEMLSSDVEKPEVTDYATAMTVIYSMVKQDYTMQERIISSLNLKSSSEELGSYYMMWSLRPFMNDEIMRQAWKLVR
ncbi:hypothetical protein LguiA_023549 [Lonicera macranthoides]